MGSRLHNAPIVIDNGSGTIRAGFAGEDVPKCFFPSYVGRPKHVRTMAGALEGDLFIGPQAQAYKGLFKINYPLEHGIVTDWDDMERIWQYVYNEGLKTVSEDVSRLCATDRPRRPVVGYQSLTGYFSTAPSTSYRTSAKPSRKSRHGSSDPLRNLQRPCAIQLCSSCSLTLRFRKDNRTGAGLWRWRLARSPGVPRIRDTQQYQEDRCRWTRCNRAPADAATESRASISYKRGEGDSQSHQGGNRLRSS